MKVQIRNQVRDSKIVFWIPQKAQIGNHIRPRVTRVQNDNKRENFKFEYLQNIFRTAILAKYEEIYVLYDSEGPNSKSGRN